MLLDLDTQSKFLSKLDRVRVHIGRLTRDLSLPDQQRNHQRNHELVGRWRVSPYRSS